MAKIVEKMSKKSQAYLTVYLALTLSVLLSLCLALIEGARSNAIHMESECVMDIGLNSILAEYHRELLNQYNLFAIDSSYGTEHAGYENTENHLQQYLERNLSMEDIFLSDFVYRDFLAMSVTDTELTKVSILTDGSGNVFRRRAVEAVKDDIGFTLLEELKGWMQVIDANDLDTRDIASQKHAVDEQIAQIQEYEEIEVPIENPTDDLEENRKKGILKMAVEDPDSLSVRTISQDVLIMSRMEQGFANKGNMDIVMDIKEGAVAEELLERFFFQEYLMEYMGHYGKEDETNALLYQLEYLIAGKDNDLENLRIVADRICAVREAANAVYIFSDEEKCMEAELVATVVASLLQVPEITSLLKVSLLLGWAYAESVYDVKTLLAGGKIPLMKDAENWHYSLQGALQAEEVGDMGQTDGLSYEDYLRILMMFTKLDDLTGRAMNMVEADIRLTPGNSAFRLDGCYDRVEACVQIKSAYGYKYEITRQKGY